jgi:hypothetical protein
MSANDWLPPQANFLDAWIEMRAPDGTSAYVPHCRRIENGISWMHRRRKGWDFVRAEVIHELPGAPAVAPGIDREAERAARRRR